MRVLLITVSQAIAGPFRTYTRVMNCQDTRVQNPREPHLTGARTGKGGRGGGERDGGRYWKEVKEGREWGRGGKESGMEGDIGRREREREV